MKWNLLSWINATQFLCWAAPICSVGLTLSSAAELRIGVAARDITPDYPVRLSGFGFRREESTDTTQRIWAKALAFADEENGPAILITADNLGIPEEITDIVAKRLAPSGLKRERLTITATHTHTAPMLRGVAPTLFGEEIPTGHQERIDRYTREFTDKLVEVALAAVADVRPSRAEWGTGTVGFAKNRRKQGGPVDHDLPILVVRMIDGNLRAVWFSYACHCVTLSNNLLSGDWAGFAQASIQEDHPNCIALASVGCGADSNPDSGVTGDKVDAARSQGKQIADEVKRLLGSKLQPLTQPPITTIKRMELPLDAPRSRAEWEERSRQPGAVGYHARVNLARLDRDETLQSAIAYPVQTWTFGSSLAAVFLPGEVVADYSLRLKREFDRARLVVVAYANDAPCYIPSERVLKEGGYEGGDAMIYYDRPQKFAAGLEQRIIDVAHSELPQVFAPPAAAQGTDGTLPKLPEDSRQCIRVPTSLSVELVAAEPLVESPVAIDWDAHGRLWVCEMFDYPSGVDGNWKPGGRIKVLEDRNGDGTYDSATVFADGLPFPTGVLAWKEGVLICAAPDILYAVDRDNDGRADKVEKLFTGFETNNYQARVNGLCLGLDNWIYGANGLLGGEIRGGKIEGELNIRGHDFRLKPDSGEFEVIAGLSQHGRVRDDWGSWFGCDNSRLLFQFPLEDRYLRRNPRLTAPPAQAPVSAAPAFNRVFPISVSTERYNHPESAGWATSACGLGIYRDVLLGDAFEYNAFTCEPVHNLVHREVLTSDGVLFTAARAVEEQAFEFLASTDSWFRPVQARTGPDGAFYVVDMYRFLIEHPRWIPPDRLARIDARAGATMGRIYRIVPKGAPLRRVRDLSKLSTPELAGALNSPNGTERDRVHLEVLRRADPESADALAKLMDSAEDPAVRAQAASVLDGLDLLSINQVAIVMRDADARVRKNAIRISEKFLTKGVQLPDSFRSGIKERSEDPDTGVRCQLALTVGEWDDPAAADILAKLASTMDSRNPYLRAALLSSGARHPGAVANLQDRLVRPLFAPAAEAELKRLGANPAEGAAKRIAVTEHYATQLPRNASSERGSAVFARACALCHKVGGVGFEVGPSLLPMRDKPEDYWIKNILDPNAAIEPRFVATQINLNDGGIIAGIIQSETGTSVSLIQPGGLTGTLLKTEIRQSMPAKSSLMPADFEGSLSTVEMADLIAYLRSPANN